MRIEYVFSFYYNSPILIIPHGTKSFSMHRITRGAEKCLLKFRQLGHLEIQVEFNFCLSAHIRTLQTRHLGSPDEKGLGGSVALKRRAGDIYQAF